MSRHFLILFPKEDIVYGQYLLGKAYSSTDIRQMERELLSALSFNFSRPLPLHFLHRYCKAAGADDIEHTMAKYFVETCTKI